MTSIIRKSKRVANMRIQLNSATFSSATNGDDRKISFEEKKELMTSIQDELNSNEFDGILDIVRSSEPYLLKTATDEEMGPIFEFDLEKLSTTTLNKLRKYVEICFKNRQTDKKSSNEKISKQIQPQTSDCLNKRKFLSGSKGKDLKRKFKFGNQELFQIQPVHTKNIDHDQHYMCPAIRKLKSKICYICGLASKTYKITDHVRSLYKKRFGLDLVIQYCTPDTVCGTCRANFSYNSKKNGFYRKFKFVKPMIWFPASNHLEPNCDCYFCKVESNCEFFLKKNKNLQPTNTTCILPQYNNIDSYMNDKSFDYLHRIDGNSSFANQINSNDFTNKDLIMEKLADQNLANDSLSNINSPNDNPSNRLLSVLNLSTDNSAGNLDSLKKDLNISINQVREDLFFICDKLDRKLDSIDEKVQRDLEMIKNQIQNISNSSNFTNMLMMLRNAQNSQPTDLV